MTIKTIVADDHSAVRLGLRIALERAPRARFSVVGEAENANRVLESLQQHACDLLITDYRMPQLEGGDGLALLRQVRLRYPRLPVLVLTTLDNPMVLRAILDSGARGLYDKQECLSHLSTAAHSLMRGNHYLSARFTRRLAEYEVEHRGAHERLSARELEVLRLLVGGMSGRDVAARLQRSEKTISRQKRCAMEKLGIGHDAALQEYAAVVGLPD
ncbi:response regulator [Pseudomonas sp. CFBP 13710]|uniref:response regulator n=1 Tax=Pseudomonas sp. CFBP 13710 TaxID=2775311 RepID=UPI00178064AC|nr:response regulator [Pseudomonas sp. CFBP 13710]